MVGAVGECSFVLFHAERPGVLEVDSFVYRIADSGLYPSVLLDYILSIMTIK